LACGVLANVVRFFGQGWYEQTQGSVGVLADMVVLIREEGKL
jgi:hypothetical protein